METYGGVDVQIRISLTSVLVGGEWSSSRSGRFNPWEIASDIHWIRDLVGPTTGLDDMKKILDPTETRTPTPQSSST
jgi:hypothetical protein